MADTQHPLLQCFRGDCYPLSIFMRHNLISGMEEKMIEFARFKMGVLNLDSVPFFECNRPEAFFAPFSVVRKNGYLKHFHEFRMFQIMDNLYLPMRMKVLQSPTLELTQQAQLYHWQRLSFCLDKKYKTTLDNKELSTVFAVSQCLKNIRYYLEKRPDSPLSAEYKSMAAAFEKQMIGVPEFYYQNVIVNYPKFCAHSDSDFAEKSVAFVLDTEDCFDVKNQTPSTKLTEDQKNERILNLVHLADKALFYNPCFTKTTQKKVFNSIADFSDRIKKAYHKREEQRFIQARRNEGRGPYGG